MPRRPRSIGLTLVLAAMLMGPSQPAWSQDPSETETAEPESLPPPQVSAEVQALIEDAARRFDSGDHAGAIEAFEAAYALDPDPNFLYNIGRIHEEAGDLENAIHYYRDFARKPSVPLELRRQALERIQVLRAVVEETQESPTVAEPPPPTATPTSQPPASPNPAPPVERSRQDLPSRRMQWAGVGLLAVGGAVGIAAGVLGGLAFRDSRSLASTEEPERRDELRTRGQSRAAAADGLFIATAVVSVVGIVLTAVGASRLARRSSRQARRSPAWPHAGLRF